MIASCASTLNGNAILFLVKLKPNSGCIGTERLCLFLHEYTYQRRTETWLRRAKFCQLILTGTELRYSLIIYTANYTEGSYSEPTTLRILRYCRLTCFVQYLNLTHNTLLWTATINMPVVRSSDWWTFCWAVTVVAADDRVKTFAHSLIVHQRLKAALHEPTWRAVGSSRVARP